MANHIKAVALAAVTALGLPVVCLLATAPAATAATSSISYLTSSTSPLLSTAKAMAGTAPGQAKPVTNQVGTATGWVEHWSQGSSGQPISGPAPAPSGRGYMFPRLTEPPLPPATGCRPSP